MIIYTIKNDRFKTLEVIKFTWYPSLLGSFVGFVVWRSNG